MRAAIGLDKDLLTARKASIDSFSLFNASAGSRGLDDNSVFSIVVLLLAFLLLCSTHHLFLDDNPLALIRFLAFEHILNVFH
jgi:hypothetical protein